VRELCPSSCLLPFSRREGVSERLVFHLSSNDLKAIGCDIKTAQYGWPIGMPLIRKLEPGLWEVRSSINKGIARVIFTIENDATVMLHGFFIKSAKTLSADFQVARDQSSKLRGAQ
jgi:phage-related protein